MHTTQFAIRDPAIGLFDPVLRLARRTVTDWCTGRRHRPVMIAGVVGTTAQAVREAEIAASLDYDAALLSLAAFRDADNREALDHCRRVAEVIPIVGFYLQPAVGGRILDRAFWRGFLAIERVVAIKVAPFDRYRTRDVVTALAESGREDVALYTGNDDAIVTDLLTPFPPGANQRPLRFSGGLLGQWAVWTNGAVDLLRRCHAVTSNTSDHADGDNPLRLLALGAELTDANAALFDPAHQFAGCLPGIHEVLRRQGAVGRTMVPRSTRGSESGTDERHRPRSDALRSPDRRRVREGASAPMALVTIEKMLRHFGVAIVLVAGWAAEAPTQVAPPPGDLVLLAH